MKLNRPFLPWLLMGVGIVFLLILMRATDVPAGQPYLLPPLALLFMSELGMLVNAVGAYLAGRNWVANRRQITQLFTAIGCALLAVALAFMGMDIWNTLQAAANT